MGTELRCGDVAVCVVPGDYGKPRPAVVVQSDFFNDTHSSLVVCPVTSDLKDAPFFRLPLKAEQFGLEKDSQIMVDKIVAVKKEGIKAKISRVGKKVLVELNRSLAVFLGLA